MREIETLLRELKRYGNAGRDCALAAEDALAIAAALEAAREDVARLDWLASKAPHLYVDRDHGCYELPYFDITSGRECCDPGDLRAAIDQAMKE